MKAIAHHGGLSLRASVEEGDFSGEPLRGCKAVDHAIIDEGRVHPLKSAQSKTVHTEVSARFARRVSSDNVEAVGIMRDIAHKCRRIDTSLFRKGGWPFIDVIGPVY